MPATRRTSQRRARRHAPTASAQQSQPDAAAPAVQFRATTAIQRHAAITATRATGPSPSRRSGRGGGSRRVATSPGPADSPGTDPEPLNDTDNLQSWIRAEIQRTLGVVVPQSSGLPAVIPPSTTSAPTTLPGPSSGAPNLCE